MNDEKKNILIQFYIMNNYPSKAEKINLASRLNLEEKQISVKIYFK